MLGVIGHRPYISRVSCFSWSFALHEIENYFPRNGILGSLIETLDFVSRLHFVGND